MPRKKTKARSKIKAHDEYAEPVQLDEEDPINDRRSKKGTRRLALNARERQIIREGQLMEKALVLFAEHGKTIPNISSELDLALPYLSTAIMTNEHPELRKAVVKRAVEMFLDFNKGTTRKQIQEELGLSDTQLKNLTQSEDFELMYNEHFFELRSHPTIRAVQSKIVDDLLPRSYRVFEQILDNATAPASVRLKAALAVWDRAGIQAVDPQKSNRQELAAYLTQHNVNIENVNVSVPIPPEFRKAVAETVPDEVVDGDFVDSTEESDD